MACFGRRSILSDAVGAAATIVSGLAYNIESYVVGREDVRSCEEIYYTTVNNTIIAAGSSFLHKNSKLSQIIPSIKIPYLKIGLDDLVRGGLASVVHGMQNSEDFKSFKTHWWERSKPERLCLQ